MKKFLFFAALTCVALMSCTKNEAAQESTSERTKISFSAPVVGVPTKALVTGEISNPYSESEHFSVYGFWSAAVYSNASTGSKYIAGDGAGQECAAGTVHATHKGWYPTHDYYWPKDGYLTFDAYSPSGITTGTVTHAWGTGLQIAGFTTPANVSALYDLMYSERSYNHQLAQFSKDGNNDDDDNSGTNKYYDGVDILFQHALSSIEFKVRTKENYSATTEIKLTGLTLKNVYTVGTFNQNITDGTSYTAAPAWSAWGTEAEYAIVKSGDQTVNYNSGTAEVLAVHASPSEGTNLPMAADPRLLLIPQALNHTATSKKVTLTVDFTMKTTGDAVPQSVDIDLTTATVGGSALDTWAMGKRYIYTIIIGLDKIYFDPAVTAWDDVKVDNITI